MRGPAAGRNRAITLRDQARSDYPISLATRGDRAHHGLMTHFLRSSARRVLAIAGAVAIIAACAAGGASAHAGASSRPLVYICQQAPCANAQELEVSDGNGAPIFSVGEYGGPAVFGDNFKIFPPNTVYRPAVTESWESPAAYDRAFGLAPGCAPPSVWIEPGGIWICAAGRWVLRLRL